MPRDPGSAWCLPNALTAARVAAIPAIVFMAGRPGGTSHAVACAAFAAAGATDWLDGALARRGWGTTRIGTLMDPIADKMLVAATLMALVGGDRAHGWATYPAIAIVLREILVSGFREHLAGDGLRLASTRMAKWKTAAQMTALGTMLAGDTGAAALGLPWLPADRLGPGLLWVAAAMTVGTGWGYARATLAHATRGKHHGTDAEAGRPESTGGFRRDPRDAEDAMDETTPLADGSLDEARRGAADTAWTGYDLGDAMQSLDQSDWEWDDREPDRIERTVWLDDGGDGPPIEGRFKVVFDANSADVGAAWAEVAGAVIGTVIGTHGAHAPGRPA